MPPTTPTSCSQLPRLRGKLHAHLQTARKTRLAVAAAPSKPRVDHHPRSAVRRRNHVAGGVRQARESTLGSTSAARPLWQQLSVRLRWATFDGRRARRRACPPRWRRCSSRSCRSRRRPTPTARSLRARLDELQRALHRCQQRVEMPEPSCACPPPSADAVAAAPTDRGGGEARGAARARRARAAASLGAALEEVERLMPRRLWRSFTAAVWRRCPTSAPPGGAEGTAEHIVQFWQRYEEHTDAGGRARRRGRRAS